MESHDSSQLSSHHGSQASHETSVTSPQEHYGVSHLHDHSAGQHHHHQQFTDISEPVAHYNEPPPLNSQMSHHLHTPHSSSDTHHSEQNSDLGHKISAGDHQENGRVAIESVSESKDDDVTHVEEDNDNDIEAKVNPWAVETVEVFHFYCCPECDAKCQSIQKFESHAIEAHPKSKELFEKTDVKPVNAIKLEPLLPPLPLPDDGNFYYDDYDEDYDPEADLEDINNVKEESDEDWRDGDDLDEDKEYVPKRKRRSRSSRSSRPRTTKRIKREEVEIKEEDRACTQCDQVFKSMFAYAKHVNLEHNLSGMNPDPAEAGAVASEEGRMQCPDCQAVLDNLEKLRQHVRRVHGAPNTCPKCDKPVKNLALHMKNVHADRRAEKPYKCQECDFATHIPKLIQQHTYVRHRKDEHLKCDQCPKRFPFGHLLQQHIDIKHRGLNSQHVCDKCGKSFAYSHAINHHVCRPPGVEREKLKCVTCGDLFGTLGHYISHHRSAHGCPPPDKDSSLKHLCDQCPKIFASKNGLVIHKRQKHSNLEPKTYNDRKSFMCTVCGKSYKSQNNLTEHERAKHQNFLPFECDKCDKKFGTKIRLRMHAKAVHEREQCPECGQKITNTYWLLRHMASAHGIHKEGAIHCDFCPRFFFTQLSKEKHIQTHHANDATA